MPDGSGQPAGVASAGASAYTQGLSWAAGPGRELPKARTLSAALPSVTQKAARTPRNTLKQEGEKTCHLISVRFALGLVGGTSRSGKQAYSTSHLGPKTGTPIPTCT